RSSPGRVADIGSPIRGLLSLGERPRFPVVSVRVTNPPSPGRSRLTTAVALARLEFQTRRFSTRRAAAPLADRVLAPDPELADDRAVTLDVVATQVVEHAPAATDEHQQPPLAVKVLLVDLHVLREMPDPLGQERDLHFGRPGVGVVQLVLGDRGGLVRHRETHVLTDRPRNAGG